jgi:beta-glucosidase
MAPDGFRSHLNWVYKRYGVPIYVTEQGCTIPQSPQPEDSTEAGLNDEYRVEYYTKYLERMARAVKEDGVDVRSYLAWSLLDNFEWAHGFSQRFGVTYVDFNDPKRARYPKRSSAVLKWIFNQLIEK